MKDRYRIAYLSLQAVVDGQDTWAAVTEVIRGWEADGLEVDRYFPRYDERRVPGGLRRLVESRRVQRRLAERIGEFDAIYVRAHQFAWPTSRLAQRRGIPVVQECNGPYDDLYTAWPAARLGRPLFDKLQRDQYRGAAAIVSVSPGLTSWLADESGNEHIVTSGNGANTDVFRPDAPRRQGLPDVFAVFFGQFPPWQGISSLLEAVRLPDWPPGLPLVFVGDGAMRGDIMRAEAELPDRVLYLGRLPYAEVAGVVAHAAMSFVPMVAPERETKFSPLKLYESMACGVPVVASDTIGISEVVRETGCGLLVTAGDAAAIAEATAGMIADPARAAEMGRRGRIAVEQRYSWTARSRERLAVVEAAIERGSSEGTTFDR